MKRLMLLVILFSSMSFASDPLGALRMRAIREGWTFKFSHHKSHHGMGLKKKRIFQAERTSFQAAKIEVPNALDLRSQLTSILDQGDCGSCWAHSLITTLRDDLALSGNDPGTLSPQFLVDCAANASACDGGYFDAAKYLISPNGAPTLGSYPYTAIEGQCLDKKPVASIQGYHLLGNSQGPTTYEIEAYMAQFHRPVSIVVAASAGAWENYDSGVYNGCTFAESDHMINIVGFDNEHCVFDSRGSLPNGCGIWILRNSWGTSWGEQGWMRTKMTDKNGLKCNNVAEEAAYFDMALDSKPYSEAAESWKKGLTIMLPLIVLFIILAVI